MTRKTKTKTSKLLTKAMRRVLERMEKGASLVNGLVDDVWHQSYTVKISSWDSHSNLFRINRRTATALNKREFIKRDQRGRNPNRASYRITAAGRRALKEK